MEKVLPKDNPKSKRRLRQSQPHTIREQAQIAQAKDVKKPKNGVIRRFFRIVFKPIVFIFRPIRWLGRHLIPRYFRNSFAELKQVTWPDRKQSRQLTLAVILFSTAFGIVVSLLDFGLDRLFKKVFLKE